MSGFELAGEQFKSCKPLHFALLEHASPGGTHWDLLLERAGEERLATWRLAVDPTQASGPVAAEPIAPHRRVYLSFEGELSGGRGHVRRADAGQYLLESDDSDALFVTFYGSALNGRWRIGGGFALPVGRPDE